MAVKTGLAKYRRRMRYRYPKTAEKNTTRVRRGIVCVIVENGVISLRPGIGIVGTGWDWVGGESAPKMEMTGEKAGYAHW